MAKVPKLLTGDVSRDRPPLVPLLKSAIPYALEVISANVDIWAFSMYSSVVVVGYYAGIAGLMQPIGLVSNSLVSGSTARLDWKNRATVLNYLKKATISLVAMMIGLAILNSLVGAFLLKTLLGGSFEGGIWMIAWIAAIVVSRAVALQFHSALQLSGRQNSYLTVQFVDSLMRVGIVLGLGFCFKEIGILIGLVLTSVLKCVLCTIALKKSKV
jgi:O-antigen/teichoic acid export membrane protein